MSHGALIRAGVLSEGCGERVSPLALPAIPPQPRPLPPAEVTPSDRGPSPGAAPDLWLLAKERDGGTGMCR